MSRTTRVLLLSTVPLFVLVVLQLMAAATEPEPPDSPEVLLRKYLGALDRLDIDGATLIAKRAAGQSPGPIAELMIRHARLLAADKSEWPAKERSKQEPRGRKDNTYYTVTYSVADLVVLPPKLVLDETSSWTKKPVASEPPDFDTLIDLITGTVKPETWEDVGERGTVRPIQASLSIVVTQTQEVHKEIISLLAQLRRRMDVTVMLEARVVIVPGEVVPKETREKMTTDEWPNLAWLGQSDSKEWPTALRAILDAQQVKRLLDAADKSGSATPVRRVAMLNGQIAAISFPVENDKTHSADIQVVVANDRSRVRLTLTLDQKQVVYGSSNDGKTLAVDLPPVDGKPQKGSQRAADAKASATRRLLLVTPRIIIAEEEEERLGVAPTTHR
jgi:hypothetical protein